MTDKDCIEYRCESWTNGLKQKGLCIVVDLDSLLESHKRATVTTWGTRRSSSNTKGDFYDGINSVSLVVPYKSMFNYCIMYICAIIIIHLY